MIGVYHAVILVSLIKGTADKSQELAELCMKIILVAWVLNMIISMTNTIKSIIDKIKGWLTKRRKNMIQNKYKGQTAPEINDNCQISDID